MFPGCDTVPLGVRDIAIQTINDHTMLQKCHEIVNYSPKAALMSHVLSRNLGYTLNTISQVDMNSAEFFPFSLATYISLSALPNSVS